MEEYFINKHRYRVGSHAGGDFGQVNCVDFEAHTWQEPSLLGRAVEHVVHLQMTHMDPYWPYHYQATCSKTLTFLLHCSLRSSNGTRAIFHLVVASCSFNCVVIEVTIEL
jgi:hypothetical protein